eukprot:CAMPEP_0178370848 /NCGR_PEP_ID=MMETSP0689_2-20121128/518_1 /TAXON_ID=160604 /ORGANISM="Amphidinium massartii, Strain CS-259" /LENGTH=399 /DNA_ID=CAMNT_0019990691 /DNA_START=172 /DNA_END=1371 /DNA_ORIENTATION=+
MAPFLPQHFEAVGLSQIWVGIMFSGYSLAGMLCSSVAVVAMRRCGRIFALFLGVLLQGLTSFTFGYADVLGGSEGTATWRSLSIYTASRLVAGCGGAFANTVVYAMACDRFPNSLGKVMGINEVIIGLGFTMGPPVGTALHELGGFPLPFLVSGLVLVAFAPCVLLLARWPPVRSTVVEGDADGNSDMLSVASTDMMLVAGSLLFASSTFSLIEPTLSLHLQNEVKMDSVGIATIFTILAASYSIFGPIAGAMSDKFGPKRVLFCGGISAGLTMWVLLGLRGLLFGSSLRKWRGIYEGVVMAALGVAQACALIPSLPAMKAAAPHSSSATELVVAWFNMTLQLGLVLGPLIGTSLFEAYGFDVELSVFGCLATCYSLVALLLTQRRSRSVDMGIITPEC